MPAAPGFGQRAPLSGQTLERQVHATLAPSAAGLAVLLCVYNTFTLCFTLPFSRVFSLGKAQSNALLYSRRGGKE